MIKRFIGLFGGFAIIAGIIGGFLAVTWSYDDLVKDKPLIVCSSLEQLRDFDLQRANYDTRIEQGDNPVLMFASSEFNTYLHRSYTAKFWTDNNYGMNIMAEGYAHITDLWDAISVGAFDNGGISNDKIVFMPSMQWFMDGTKYSNATLSETYSKGAYEAFMNNEDISNETKEQISRKLEIYGYKHPTAVTSFSKAITSAYKYLDTSILELASGIRLRYAILTAPSNNDSLMTKNSEKTISQAIPSSRFRNQITPDWVSIQNDALEYAKSRSTNNDLYLDDYYYENSYSTWKKHIRTWELDKGNVLTKSEVEDFNLLLKVCIECGIEPLVILIPSHDILYDQSIYTKEYRDMYYDLVRNTCENAGIEVADLSEISASTYFLRDNCHPSDYGWSLINEQIYNFYYKE